MAKVFQFRSKYLNDQGVVVKTKYMDGQTAYQLLSVYNEPLITATVNLSEYGMYPEDGNVFIPGYSQFEGLYEGVKELGIVGPAIRTIGIGFGTGVECPWLLSDEDMRVIEPGE